MSFFEELKNYGNRLWKERRALLGELGEEAERLLAGCGEEEAVWFRYVLSTLPLSDLGGYGPGFFLPFVRHALKAREDFPWCGILPPHLFCREVLYPRINTEELAHCREEFRRALEERVKGLSLTEAALEVNRWCAEQVSYRSTDDRTASPLSVFRCGYGRCGEESVFAVNALRSVGIAARQVYAPWWSHCDDNHAWVEIFDGEKWRFLGACEPEPELDRGWFPGAASRAMAEHVRSFVQGSPEEYAFLFPDVRQEDLFVENGVALQSVTHHYAPVRRITVRVKREDGTPAQGVRVSFSVLNMAGFREVAARRTDREGLAELNLGLGSVRISAGEGRESAGAILDTSRQEGTELVLSHQELKADWRLIDFSAPEDGAPQKAGLTPEQKRERLAILDRCAALREEKSLAKEEDQPCSDRGKRILSTLTEKDRAGDVPRKVLEESERAFAWENDFSREIFDQFLLCPRISLEPLAPFRALFSDAFSKEEKELFRREPLKLWEWVQGEIREEPEACPNLCGTPAGIFQVRAAGKTGKRVLFCALCRAFGVPARFSPLSGEPEYYRDGRFVPLFSEAGVARLELSASVEKVCRERQDFTLSRRSEEGWEELSVGAIPCSQAVCPGEYRLLTTVRLPSGGQLAQSLDFSLKAGECKRLTLAFRETAVTDYLERFRLPEFSLFQGQEELSNKAFLEPSPLTLLLWLEVSREPTEHILGELREIAAQFSDLGNRLGLVFVLEQGDRQAWEKQMTDPALQKTLALLPQARVLACRFSETVPPLARSAYVDPDRLPLLLLIDRQGEGRFGCAGYNVGSGELVLRIARELLEQSVTTERMSSMKNEMLDLIKTRRSVRKYLEKPVEEEKLDAVLEAGTYAPTGMNMQSPVIVAVRTPENRRAVQELNCLARGGNGDPYYGAPVILLVLADPQRGTCVEDGACVLNTMMEAAHALGLSSCWIHGEREMFELPQGKELLRRWGLREDLRGVGSLALGYGDGPTPQPKERKADYIVKV